MKNRTNQKQKRQNRKRVGILGLLLFVLIVNFLLLNNARENNSIILNVREKTTTESSGNEHGYINKATSWEKMLVNRWNPIPQNYSLEVVKVEGGERVDKRIYESLMEMLNSAKAQGFAPEVVSGYRTVEEQKEIMEDKIVAFQKQGYSKKEAIEHAEKWVALPGTSEHELGLAVDINGVSYDLYLWLQENSHKYGFIFRYPDNKKEITGIEEEVWHYRYVGIDTATEIYEENLSLEEYLENIK